MEQNKTIIQCKRAFSHPVEKVFEAFLDPVQLKEWFGPKEFSIGEVSIMPLEGDHYAIEMINPKGQSLWIKGTYREIIPRTKIVFTFSYAPDTPGIGESLVTVNFKSRDDQTEIVLIQVIYKSVNPEGRTKGWEAGFDKLEMYLQTRPD